MLFLKSIPIIALLIVAIFKESFPTSWKTKKRVKSTIVILLVVAALINISILISDNSKNITLRKDNQKLNTNVDSLNIKANKAQLSLDSISLKLEPFIKYALIKYPKLTPDSALIRLKNEFEQVKIKTAQIDNRTNIIANLELRVYLDEITEARAITDKKTSAGRQSVVGFFDLNNKRYRFVTDYQFAHQQVMPTLHRGYLIYKPEEPNEILGKPIVLLNQFMDFRVNYSEVLKYIGFSKTNKLNKITALLYLNGIEMIILKDNILPPAMLYEGELSFPVTTIFNNFDKKYYSLIDNRQ